MTPDDRGPFAIDEWPYLQVADRLEDRIRGGEFGSDGPLPATAELVEWYGQKPGVIRHARQELQRRGLIVFRLGHGYFTRLPQKSTRSEHCPRGPFPQDGLGGIAGNALIPASPRMLATVRDTWFSRELPVLDAAVSLIDEGIDFPEATDIAARSGLDVKDVARALLALKGEYVDLLQAMGDSGGWAVREVTSDARRAVGQWPSPEGLVDALAEAFGSAAEREHDPEKKSRLRQVGTFLGSTGRGVATEVVSKVILHSSGMG